MSATSPLVSLCMPAFNAGLYIEEAILSIIDQTYTNWELIVVDDGSTDDTKTIVAKLALDKRIHLLHTGRGGASKARNTAYQNAKGDHIIFFDADDHLSPNFLTTQVNKLRAHPNAVVLADWGRFYGNESTDKIVLKPIPFEEITFDGWIARYWHQCDPMTNPGRALIPRALIERSGTWNEQLSLNDDLEFFTRIMLNAEKIIFNHDALLGYRSGVSGLSSMLGDKATTSLFTSIELSVQLVLDRYGDQPIIRQACANMWQYFIYLTYPQYTELLKKAQRHLTGLPAPTIKYPVGGYSKLLRTLIGWKAVKLFKRALKLK